jgi:hypothetical protein
MANKININTVNIPTKGDAVAIIIDALGFPLPAEQVVFYYQLLDNNDTKLMDGNLYMDNQDLQSWGSDDEYAINWAIDKLKLTRNYA